MDVYKAVAMRLSGFTFMRNADKLYYPYIESLLSMVDLVDEVVVALGNNDSDDNTLESLQKLNNPKIKILHTVWDVNKFSEGTIYAQQTDIAKQACNGDWLLYLQSDEVVHEKYHPVIKEYCFQYLHDHRVEGFLFRYLHFWGDYEHIADQHGWYPREIRIIRNRSDIHSWGDAQSFRRIPRFDGVGYRTKKGSFKLKVKEIPAYIYHYGWVRPPSAMLSKTKVMDAFYHKGKDLEKKLSYRLAHFDYGNLSQMTKFTGTHPQVMRDFIDKFSWKDELHYEKDYKPKRPKLKHEKFSIRLLSWFEKVFFKGLPLFGYKNWDIIK